MATDTKYRVVHALIQFTQVAKVYNPAIADTEEKAAIQYAFQGEVVTGLLEIDEKNLLHWGGIEEVTEDPADPSSEESGEPEPKLISEMSDDELTEYIRTGRGGKKPSIKVLVDAVDNQPDGDAQELLAQRILDAENTVTEGDPRAGLVEGLNPFLEEDDEDDDDEDDEE